MRVALELAKATEGQTSPNPMVGAVVVRQGHMIGSGAHLGAGTPHAEVHALHQAGDLARGATLYVTLEPCCHHGRTPPCTERIISSGVARVMVGAKDPDIRVSGRGIARLREAGIEVVTGVLEEDCLKLNEAYFHHRRTGKPLVTLKTAMTLDGKIATAGGDSKWITCEASREYVHELRHRHDAILVGVDTVLADNPKLTTRLKPGGISPLRVILDSRLRMSLEAAVTDVSDAPTWIFTTNRADPVRIRQFQDKGVRVTVTGDGPRVDVGAVLSELGRAGILSVLVEGGGQINASFVADRHVNRVIAFIAPKILGGKESPTPVEGKSPERMAEALKLTNIRVMRFEDDICITGEVEETS